MRKWSFRKRKQRWKCNQCQKTYTVSCGRNRHLKYFKIWITTQTPLHILAGYAGVSTKTLQRSFYTYLLISPKPKRPVQNRGIYLKVDATYFKEWGCLIVYKAGKDILYWQYAEREHDLVYQAGIRWLQSAGYIIKGATSDWHGSIVRSVKKTLNVPHQRCLIHTQRQCESLLTRKPKTEAGQSLRYLVLELNHITTQYEKNIWTHWFNLWIKRHEYMTRERTYSKTNDGKNTWWYTHKNLRKVYRSLANSQDHLFLYLEDKNLDKDTNGLEGEFKHLKAKLSSHSGLRKKKRAAFISWYLYLKKH